MKKQCFCSLLLALFVVNLAGLPLYAKGERAGSTPPQVTDQKLQIVLDAIEKGDYLEWRELTRVVRNLGRGEAVLTSPQTSRAWELYDKHEKSLGTQTPKRGRRPASMSYDGAAMVRTYLFFELFKRMKPEDIRPIPIADTFPGTVADPPDSKPIRVLIDTRRTRWHSTGSYALPGQVVKVTIPSKYQKLGFKVQIGCHKDNLYIWNKKQKTSRWPLIVLSKPIQSVTTTIANPFGGLVYIVVPNEIKSMTRVPVKIENAIQAPRFILGRTDVKKWKATIRHYPAPWAELENDKIAFTVPSQQVRSLENPTELMKFWRKVAVAQDDLSGRKPPRYQERFVFDQQISAGWMHSGYPIMAHLVSAKNAVDYDKLSTKGDWGFFHELGHNHQRSPWRYPVEVTVNIFSMYTMEHVVGLKTEEVGWYKKCIPAVNAFYKEGKKGDGPACSTGFTLPLAMYIHLRKKFGWGFYKKVFRQYEAIGSKNWPRQEQDRRDLWLVITSKASGHNLVPYYEKWDFATSDQAKAKIKHLPNWNPSGYESTSKISKR